MTQANTQTGLKTPCQSVGIKGHLLGPSLQDFADPSLSILKQVLGKSQNMGSQKCPMITNLLQKKHDIF